VDRRKTADAPARVPALEPAPPAHSLEELRTLVTISRAHPSDVQQRQVVARLDGGPKITLYFGDSFTQEIPPGTHRLRVHNTLFIKTVEFHVEPGEHLEFVLINRASLATLAFLTVLGVGPLFLDIHTRSVV
jgi:hypothetical protein